MTLLFVYGTLKRTHENHHFMAGQAFAGAAQTPPGYTLYDLAGFPGMVRQGDDLEGVRGEVWSVDDDCLARLDELEGVDEGLYSRETVPLGNPFEKDRVEAYLYLKDTGGRPRIGAEWPR
ncbi:MAG TPA: gamma-glutamylcyclotransferase family protein [Opitutaceae bacterium]|nr:gamma-glutamylcyclotransferase family protein [Opitutaceae bacterium]